MTGKSNQERITEVQEEIEQIEERCGKLSDKLAEKKDLLNEIESNKKQSKQDRKEIEQIRNKVENRKNQVEKLKNQIENTKDSLDKKLTSTTAKKEDIDVFFEKVFGEEDEDGNMQGGLKQRLNKKEDQVDQVIADSEEKFEELLDGMEEDYDKLYSKIESLLPGAASVGIAKSFMTQKESYTTPKTLWMGVFFISIVLLGYTSSLDIGSYDSIESVLSGILGKLPLYAALIWLGTFAAKRYKENRRLEEEYAHKEVLARSYQGYEREFGDNKATSEKLQKAVINAFARNPGNLLDEYTNDDRPGAWERLLRKNSAKASDKKSK